MIKNTDAIGVMDSGIGGLSVVRELQRILPGERLIYRGDNRNCPYGNRTEDEILALSQEGIRFLESMNVKCIVIACNTISTLCAQLRRMTRVEIISIVEEAAKCVARLRPDAVGLIATEFTVGTGKYDELIHKNLPFCRVISKGSPLLAGMIDHGDADAADIQREICKQVDSIMARERVDRLILGCTHYPIVADQFRKCYPKLELIDPAREQAAAVRAYLQREGLLNADGCGGLEIYTTGAADIFQRACRRLRIAANSVQSIG